jgi:hypothetical protein
MTSLFNETNWYNDNSGDPHSLGKTISAGTFNKLVITYSTDDIYLISETSTTISGVEDAYAYTGSPIKPVPVVVCNGRTLTENTHYHVAYHDFTDPGTASLVVVGKGLFSGSVSKNYEISDPQLVWSAGSNIQVTTDRVTKQPILVTGTGNVNLVIADGVTLTAQGGITIADGATLTMIGPGSLTVTGKEGDAGAIATTIGDNGGNGNTGGTGISGSLIVYGGTVNVTGGTGGAGGAGAGGSFRLGGGTGGTGGAGGTGISGSLTVNGGTVTAEGGTGGTGGNGASATASSTPGDGGDGGAGGMSLSGSLTVNGGTVITKGGAGGAGGAGGKGFDIYSDEPGSNGRSGASGHALDGSVICTIVGYVIQESRDNRTWNDLTSGSTSTLRYVRVVATQNYTLSARPASFAGQTRYWVTFYHPYLSFQLPAGAQAFTMKEDKALYRVGDGSVVPANCAVVIMADASALTGVSGGIGTLTLTATSASATPESGNILRGESAATSASSLVSGNQQVYVLGKDSVGNVGFYEYTGTIPANKAYYVE